MKLFTPANAGDLSAFLNEGWYFQLLIDLILELMPINEYET